jgi:hypothetical protein
MKDKRLTEPTKVYGGMPKMFVVLTPTQYQNKEIVNHFRSGGYEVYKSRKVKNTNL